jgi:hypothetical protein
MPDTLIEEKVERALVAVLVAANTGIAPENIYPGTAASTKTVPYIECLVLGATEDPQCPGNWTVRARVGTYGNADDGDTPAATHNEQAGAVSDELMKSDLGASLSAAVSGLTVYDPPVARRKVPDTEGRKWVKWMELDLYCLNRDA